jgi:hypothetical protein
VFQHCWRCCIFISNQHQPDSIETLSMAPFSRVSLTAKSDRQPGTAFGSDPADMPGTDVSTSTAFKAGSVICSDDTHAMSLSWRVIAHDARWVSSVAQTQSLLGDVVVALQHR